MVMDPSYAAAGRFRFARHHVERNKESGNRQRGCSSSNLQNRKSRWPRSICRAFTPIEGPPARRFANNYTRLFVRYPGLEDSKLGRRRHDWRREIGDGRQPRQRQPGYGYGAASPPSAQSPACRTQSPSTRTIHSAYGLRSNVSFATWEKSVDDQQQLLAGSLVQGDSDPAGKSGVRPGAEMTVARTLLSAKGIKLKMLGMF